MQYNNTSREEQLLKLLEEEPEYQFISQKFKETNDLRIQFIRDQIIKNIQTDLEKYQKDKNYIKASQKLAEYTNDLFIIQGTDKNFYVSTQFNSLNHNRISDKYDLGKIQAQSFLDPQLNQAFTQDIDSFLADINRFDMKKIQSEIDSIVKNQTIIIQQQLKKRILYDIEKNEQLQRLEDYIKEQEYNLGQFFNTIELFKMKNPSDNYNQIYDLNGDVQIIQRVSNPQILFKLMQYLQISYLKFEHLSRITQYMKDIIQQEKKKKQIKLLDANKTSIQQLEQFPQPQNTVDQINRNAHIKILPQQTYQNQQDQQIQRLETFDNRQRSPNKNKIIIQKNYGQTNYIQNQPDRYQNKK